MNSPKLPNGLSRALQKEASKPLNKQNNILVIGCILGILAVSILIVNIFKSQLIFSLILFFSVVWVLLYVLGRQSNYYAGNRAVIKYIKQLESQNLQLKRKIKQINKSKTKYPL